MFRSGIFGSGIHVYETHINEIVKIMNTTQLQMSGLFSIRDALLIKNYNMTSSCDYIVDC